MRSFSRCRRPRQWRTLGLRRLVAAMALLGRTAPAWASFGGKGYGEVYATAYGLTLLMPPGLLVIALLVGALTPELRWVIPHAIIAATLGAILVCHAVMSQQDLWVFTIFGLIGASVGLVGGLSVWLWRVAKRAKGQKQ